MGIDPGLTRCGLSVVQAGQGRAVLPVAVGVVRTPPSADLTERLLRLSNAVNEWMDDYTPDVVAIERIFERGNVSTVMHTAHAVGVLVLAAAADALALAVCHCWRAPLLLRQEHTYAQAEAQRRHQQGRLGKAKADFNASKKSTSPAQRSPQQ